MNIKTLRLAHNLSVLNLCLGLVFCISITGCKNIFSSEDSGSTAESGFAPGLDPIPAAVTLNVVTSAVGKVTVSWSGVEYAKSYNVLYRPTGTNEFKSITGVKSPYTVEGLTTGVTYDLKIESANARGKSTSDIVQVLPVAVQNGQYVKVGESVSASVQNRTTSNGYKVNGSFAGLTSQMNATTSPRGYKLYLNAQGALISGGTP